MCQRMDQGGRCYHHTKIEHGKAVQAAEAALNEAALKAGVPVNEEAEKKFQRSIDERLAIVEGRRQAAISLLPSKEDYEKADTARINAQYDVMHYGDEVKRL